MPSQPSQGRGAHLRHEELDACDTQHRVDELLAHALEQVRVAEVVQVQVAQDAPPDGRRELVQHLRDQRGQADELTKGWCWVCTPASLACHRTNLQAGAPNGDSNAGRSDTLIGRTGSFQ